MKQIYFLFLLSFLIIAQGFAQKKGNTVNVTVKSIYGDTLQTRAYLLGYYINKKRVVDTVMSGPRFTINLSDTLPKGFYNVMLYTNAKDTNGKYQRLAFDILNTGENIDLVVNITNDPLVQRVKAQAGENYVYNEYYRRKLLLEHELTVLDAAISQYPQQEDFYAQMQKQRGLLKQQLAALPQWPAKQKQAPVAAKYIAAQQALADVALNRIDYTDSLIKYSPFISQLAYNYLNSLELDTLAGARKTQAIIKHVDRLLPAFMADKDVYQQVVLDVVKNYEKTGQNEVVLYVNKNYLAQTVEPNSPAAQSIKAKDEVLQKIIAGWQAPEIEISTEGPVQKLSDIKNRYTLILFWESSCSHCQDLAKELASFYEESKSRDFEVLALALDTNKTEWLKFVVNNNLNWLNFSDLKGWESPAVKTYNVLATPSMFLLDKDKKIIAKPATVAELKQFVL